MAHGRHLQVAANNQDRHRIDTVHVTGHPKSLGGQVPSPAAPENGKSLSSDRSTEAIHGAYCTNDST